MFRIFAVCCSLFAVLASRDTANAASCNTPNLIKCLDSACAINIDLQPGARCALCGTDLAADAVKQKSTYNLGGGTAKIQALSLGRQAGVTFTDKELKSAPTDAGKRYAWAAAECMKKVSGCTADEIEKNYDKLVEQSCRAVLSDNEYNAAAKPKAAKTRTACEAEMQNAMTNEKRCGANFANCELDADFDRFFSAGIVETKCDEFATEFSKSMRSSRDSYIAARDANIESVASAHATVRESKKKTLRTACTDGSAKEQCVATTCGWMPNGCGKSQSPKYSTGITDMPVPDDDVVIARNERQYATLLCKYIDLACDRLK
ncbi:MAG: hypothetical protein LBK26_03460 [Rickettsiales bacterium]|nr:hypothetical protein [Rickettsiales bacterium]